MACQSPATVMDAANPANRAVRTITSFNESLRCMDDLFLAEGKHDVFITTAGIPDATGLVAAGTKEMFISTVSRMSAKSGAFRFVDYDPRQLDIVELSKLIGVRDDFVAPSYYVRGAITQLDGGVLSSSKSAGISTPFLDLGVSHDQVVSVVSMDLNVGKLTTHQILPGISADNSIAVVQTGKGADVGGLIGKAGLTFSVSLDRSEGFHQAVRTLVELSTIEVLGKLTQVPYWRCLSIASTNPAFRTEARGWYDAMSTPDREHVVRSALVRAGYTGDANDLSPGIARYQAENDLIASGHIDFDLYYRLMAGDARRADGGSASATKPPSDAPAVPASVSPPAVAPVVAAPIAAPVIAAPIAAPVIAVPVAALPAETGGLSLVSSRGRRPRYRVGETMTLEAVPDADAFVYCYYQDSGGVSARIFPNRFQPDAFVKAHARLHIPPSEPDGPFSIRFSTADTREAVACFSSDREVGMLLPDVLKADDLAPLPVAGLDDVAARFRAIPGARVVKAEVPIEVTR